MPEQHVDPVCGMKVEQGKEKARRTVEGKTFLLCSDSCVAKFDREPARFAGPKKDPSAHSH